MNSIRRNRAMESLRKEYDADWKVVYRRGIWLGYLHNVPWYMISNDGYTWKLKNAQLIKGMTTYHNRFIMLVHEDLVAKVLSSENGLNWKTEYCGGQYDILISMHFETLAIETNSSNYIVTKGASGRWIKVDDIFPKNSKILDKLNGDDIGVVGIDENGELFTAISKDAVTWDISYEKSEEVE